jgi:hypothetical protein
MNKSIQSFLMIPAVFLLSSCATKIVQQGTFQKGQWETKAQIKNLRENKNQTVSIDIYAVKNQRARFEISALLGYQVASLVMSPDEISYAIYPKKTFYFGRNSDRAFQQILNLPLHPMNLSNIAFDEPIQGPGWRCTVSANGLIASCENPQRQISVQWTERAEGRKKVLIQAPQFEMTWAFPAAQTEVEFKTGLFTLKQPSGFKAIQLN